MTYEEAVRSIDSLLTFGIRPGLSRIGELMKRLGDPQESFRTVHVAGTNGKGSVCALLSSVLTQAGYKTGLFISPFVLDFRERFQINGSMIEKQKLTELVEEIYPVVLQMKDEGLVITEFEFVFAVAACWFSREKCDIVVLETGLGGRFDATNIIKSPLASVIMSISLDHTKILGDTTAKIAFEKCGIIKPGGYTVCYGEQPQDAEEVIRTCAKEKNNILVTADTEKITDVNTAIDGSDLSYTIPDGKTIRVHIPFLGEHQLKNAAAALCTICVLKKQGIKISDEDIKNGFKNAFFPARLELLSKEPLILLDGAHNPGGTEALYNAVKKHLSGKRKTALIGMLADKDIETALSKPITLFDEIITTTPTSPRAMPAEKLSGLIKNSFDKSSYPIDKPADALRLALEKTGKHDALVVFGSLYLASEIRKEFLSICKGE